MHRFAPQPATTERIAQIVVLLIACAFGVDYLMEPPQHWLYPAEQMIGPLVPWGAMFLTFGIMGLLGELWMEIGRARNRWWPAFAAHFLLCGLYFGLAAGCVTEQFINGHFYGLRLLSVTLMFGTWHGFFAERRRHAP